MIEANDILAYASICISALIGTLYALQTGRITKIENKVEQLTTHKDQTINDSEKIVSLQERFDLYEKNSIEFRAIMTNENKHMLEAISNIRTLIEHNHRNSVQGLNNVAKDLDRIKRKLDIE